jgi:hypothetical protein
MTSSYIYLNFFSTWSDAGGFISLLNSVREGFGMVSPAYNTPTWMLTGEIGSQTPIIEWCAFERFNAYANFSKWHPFLILYPIAYISNIFNLNSVSVMATLTAASYLGVIIISISILIHKKIKIYKVAIFLIIILTTPQFVYGIQGQMQADRLMILPLFALITFLFFTEDWHIKYKPIYTSFLVLVNILISERAVIYSIIVLIVFSISVKVKNGKWHLKINRLETFLLITSAMYFIYWKTFIEESEYYTKIGLNYFYSNLINSFKNQSELTLVLMVSIFTLIVLSCTNVKTFVMAALAITPQFIWSTGGSEKYAFSTQYHAGYIGVLFACALIGFIKISGFKNESKRNFAILVVVILITSQQLISGKLKNGYDINRNQIVMSLGFDFKEKSRLDDVKSQKIAFVSKIPKNTWIGSPEIFVTTLVYEGHRKIDYFPFGLKDDDYIIVPNFSEEQKSFDLLPPWLTYMYPNGQDGFVEILKCAKENTRNHKVFKSTSFQGIEYAILKK